MSADVAPWGSMSRVESPFHAIAAQAFDDPSPPENEAVAVSAAAVAAAAAPGTSSEARVEAELLKSNGCSPTENGVHEVEENKEEPEDDNVGEETSVAGGLPPQCKVATPEGGTEAGGDVVAKKSKKRTNVWTKTTSRKSSKKNGPKNGGARPTDAKDDIVVLKPFHLEDDPSYPTLLSKICKAEKIELSADRLTASGSKGYRMVRATRGVVEGAWYFEIYIENLGSTGHTRLGWCSRRGDYQAPVGYDAHSYAYRDVDGSKVHCAMREPYGEPYVEKDYIGFYINLPREANYTRKVEEEVVGWKGQPYFIVADEPLKPVPGSEILYFRNGVCQGVAFKDINDGTYFPAASMYTLPNLDICRVAFNFGPDFKYPPLDIGGRPVPSPMCNVPGPASDSSKADGALKAPPVVFTEPFDTPGIKQRMVPDTTTLADAEEQPTVPKKDKVVKRILKAIPPLAKKKEKIQKAPGTSTKAQGTSTKTSGTGTKTPSTGTKTPGSGTKTLGTGTKVLGTGIKTPGSATKIGMGSKPVVGSSSKKSKIGNGRPINPDLEVSRQIDSSGAVLNMTAHGRRPWNLENRIEGAQNVDVEVVVESSSCM